MTTPAARMPPDRSGTAPSNGAHPDGAHPDGASGTTHADLTQADPAQADTARLAAELAAERNVTLELQRAILPLHDGPFDLPGLRAVVRYLPASQDSRVGGDWYITAEMPGGHVLLAIGDVGGHGLAAAAGMARLRGALAGLAITGSPPERLVGWLNDLVHYVGPEHTASVVAGYFDPPTRVLTWVRVRGRLAGTAPRRPDPALQRRPYRAQASLPGRRAGRADQVRGGHYRPRERDLRRPRHARLRRHRGRHVPGRPVRALTRAARSGTGSVSQQFRVSLRTAPRRRAAATTRGRNGHPGPSGVPGPRG